MKKLNFILFIILVLNVKIFAKDLLDEGTFLPASDIEYPFDINNHGKYKNVNYSSIELVYNFFDNKYGYLCEDGSMPEIIIKKNEKNNFIFLDCCSLDSTMQDNVSLFIKQQKYALKTICIEVIDNDEIVLENFEFPRKIHFYRISGPAKLPMKVAVINDSNVRLRVKPNLNCDTWTKLQKGTQVKIKDKSKEKFEIDGEKWHWYYVDADNLPDGWVYGKYLDIKK